jgi:hypothetical protein
VLLRGRFAVRVFGRASVALGLRESLLSLFNHRTGKELSLAVGTDSSAGDCPGRRRSSSSGSSKMGAAARQRRRDIMAQAEAFLRDPASSLPHYPLWDINRGFGP